MKFVVNLYLSPEAAPGPGSGREEFLAVAREAGELIGGHVLADPSVSVVVRVRAGAAEVSEGPYLRAAEPLTGQYLLDCPSLDRAVELAALSAAGWPGGVEVWPLMDAGGMEM
ncbi:YciI family protein [Actinomadura litoris]|uniref:YciI family protein n=1 Tax=Actinomadura litoris TaxID=2678616 RepID=UPI001FA72EBF|nr:YciI family protein [Actinomadura litoris]